MNSSMLVGDLTNVEIDSMGIFSVLSLNNVPPRRWCLMNFSLFFGNVTEYSIFFHKIIIKPKD